MVVTLAPANSSTGCWQARTGQLSTSTVQDPHAPSPQPGLAPVRPSLPRSTDSSDVVAGTERGVPFTISVTRGGAPTGWTGPCCRLCARPSPVLDMTTSCRVQIGGASTRSCSRADPLRFRSSQMHNRTGRICRAGAGGVGCSDQLADRSDAPGIASLVVPPPHHLAQTVEWLPHRGPPRRAGGWYRDGRDGGY